MKITATLVFFPDGSNVLAIGFIVGSTPLLLVSVGPTVMEAFQRMFAQAKVIADATRYVPSFSVN